MNADIYVSTGQGLLDSNMFAYCRSNPVVRSDAAGTDDLSYKCGDLNPGDNLKVNVGRCLGAGGGGYHVDLSIAVRSSVWSSPLQTGQWSGYYVHTPYTYCLDHCFTGDAPSANSVSASTGTIPEKAFAVFGYVKEHNWSPMIGYKGGRRYENDGRDGSATLPTYYSPFLEFDIDPKVPGQPRNGERIVIGVGSGGGVWYTPDHYRHFFVMEEGFRK